MKRGTTRGAWRRASRAAKRAKQIDLPTTGPAVQLWAAPLGTNTTLLSLILPHLDLDGRAAARLRLVSRAFRAAIDATPELRHLIAIHHVRVAHPRDMLPRGCNWWEIERFNWDGFERLDELGYTGEARTRLFDWENDEYIYCNNFYVYSYRDSEWARIAGNIAGDREFDFRFIMYEYPPLPVGRYQVLGDHMVFHRGASIWVRWKKK